MKDPMPKEEDKVVGNLEEAEKIMLEQPLDMDPSSEENNENNDRVREDCLEIDADIDLAMVSAGCKERLSTNKEIMDGLMHEWCLEVIMNLLLSQAIEQVMHTEWCLLAMRMYGKDSHECQEVDVEEEDAYVLDSEDSFAKEVEKKPIMMLEDAMEEVDAKCSIEENTCWELRN